MYQWRKMTDLERKEVLADRKQKERPWHRPPHFFREGSQQYLVSSTCYEHTPILGTTNGRMAQCEKEILEVCALGEEIHAWCILPNHYHLLIQTDQIRNLLRALGKWHGRTSRQWNLEEHAPGRKVWFGSVERAMRSERHFFATLNYIHHNPVKHGYVTRWQDWPFSSAKRFLKAYGRENAAALWAKYPILDYGADWDP